MAIEAPREGANREVRTKIKVVNGLAPRTDVGGWRDFHRLNLGAARVHEKSHCSFGFQRELRLGGILIRRSKVSGGCLVTSSIKTRANINSGRLPPPSPGIGIALA